MFDELTGEELSAASADAASAGLEAARLAAAARLAKGPAVGIGRPVALVKLLMTRDQTGPQWERLEPFELRWALLVVRIVAPVMDPVEAVADARRRGASWAAIGSALGVKAPTAHERFASRVTSPPGQLREGG